MGLDYRRDTKDLFVMRDKVFFSTWGREFTFSEYYEVKSTKKSFFHISLAPRFFSFLWSILRALSLYTPWKTSTVDTISGKLIWKWEGRVLFWCAVDFSPMPPRAARVTSLVKKNLMAPLNHPNYFPQTNTRKHLQNAWEIMLFIGKPKGRSIMISKTPYDNKTVE